MFKVAKGLDEYIRPNYIDEDYEKKEEKEEVEDVKLGTELMMVRNYHLCQGHPEFIGRFKSRYRLSDPTLMENKSMQFKIDDDLDCITKTDQFIDEISADLTYEQKEEL